MQDRSQQSYVNGQFAVSWHRFRMATLLHLAGLAVHLHDRKATWRASTSRRCFSASIITPGNNVHELSSQNPHGRRDSTLMESRRPILPRCYREFVVLPAVPLLAATLGSVTVLSNRASIPVCAGISTSLPFRAAT